MAGGGWVGKISVEQLFELSLDLLCVAGFDGYFKHLSRSWQDALGWTLDELRAQPYVELVHPADRDATAGEAARIASGTRVLQFENRYRHKNGSYRWLSWRAAPHVDEGLIYAAARDVTELKLAEDERRAVAESRDRALFLGSPLPIAVFDEETLRFVDINDAAIALYGWSREEFLELVVTDLYPPEDVTRFLEAFSRARGTSRSQG